ncbi:MAG: carbon storage regulator CsrA [Planctomycetaceae bacterium]|jgi:carbon storage regulator
MLVLSRRKNESIIINENIRVSIISVRGDRIRIGIEAPRDVTVHREEVLRSIEQETLKPAVYRTEEISESAAAGV